MREGGDTNHNNGVRYKAGEWTQALKKERNEVIKPELIGQIESSSPQQFLFSENQQQTPEGLHRDLTTAIEHMHEMPVTAAQEREEFYRALQQHLDYQEAKRAFDAWCAAWFWPVDQLEEAPTPATFYAPSTPTCDIVNELASELHFFHWELEFPDVFARLEHGFDAILANPPWETAKPLSQEFFTNYDPLYRTYSKQEALREQKRLFEHDVTIERDWLGYQAYFKSISNWTKHAASPFGDPAIEDMDTFTLKPGRKGEQIHSEWRLRHSKHVGYADWGHPFRFQGSADLSTYKMFLEVAYHLLKRSGRLGMLVPSSVYTDQGARNLRKLFLDHCRWEWLFGFINWEHIFDIYYRFKFAVVLLEKGNYTEQLMVAFNRIALADLEQPNKVLLDFPRKFVVQFSPNSLAIVEPQTQRDITILEKLYTNTVLLDDQDPHGWQLRCTSEFHMTNDSALFPPLPGWQEKGYRPDGYGRWINIKGEIALPLYEGRMIGPFDPSDKGWVSGKGRGAVWREIPFEEKVFEPQYLISLDNYKIYGRALRGEKIGFTRIGSATNARSMYATLVGDMPCGETASNLQPEKHDIVSLLSLVACLNSFAYDFALRCRLGGVTLNYFILAETPLLTPSTLYRSSCATLAACLNLIMPHFAPKWLELRLTYPHLGEQHWLKLRAITQHERLRLRCILDAIIAELYGLEYDDFAWILRDDPANPKGFWRVDKEKPKELRHTTLALAAFKRLKEVGLEAFCQEDWQFPPEIGDRLGPRFTAWQEQGTVVESWAECEEHARHVREFVVPLPENGKDPGNGKRNGHGRKKAIEPEQVDLWHL